MLTKGFTEEELAQRLDVHVSVIKQALVNLEGKGLIHRYNHSQRAETTQFELS
jgi:predicted transcriptional regulator